MSWLIKRKKKTRAVKKMELPRSIEQIKDFKVI